MRLTIQEMYEAALEAVEYVMMGNYDNSREQAVRYWLRRIRNGKRDLSIERVDARLQERAYERSLEKRRKKVARKWYEKVEQGGK